MLMNDKTNKKERKKKNMKKQKKLGYINKSWRYIILWKFFLKFFIFHDDPRNIGKY